jgi:hypothetical protein
MLPHTKSLLWLTYAVSRKARSGESQHRAKKGGALKLTEFLSVAVTGGSRVDVGLRQF